MGRPDSRMSMMESSDEEDGISSTGSPSTRPFSGETWMTDDTSMDSTATLSRDEMRSQLDQQRVEYEERLRNLNRPAIDAETERHLMESKVEEIQQQMQHKLEAQKKSFEARLRKRGVQQNLDTPEVYTPVQEKRLRRAIEELKSHHRVKIAENALVHAVSLKEANVIAKELDKQVTYQFTVIDRDPPLSAAGVFGSLAEESIDANLLSSPKPCLAIKVLDCKHTSVYIWSIQHFRAQLDSMRKVFSYVDKPVYSRHLNWDEPFYTTSAPSLSFIGTAYLPLSPLLFNVAFDTTIEILSSLTSETIGTCHVMLKPKSLILPPSPAERGATPVPSLAASRVSDGAQVTFMLVVDQLQLWCDGVSSIHCQTQRSHITGQTDSEETSPSEVANIDTQGSVKLTYYKEITVKMSQDTRTRLASKCLPLDFFGSISEKFLARVLAWDAQETFGEPDDKGIDTSRKSELELSVEQHHDVIANASICELDASGHYSPAPATATGPLDPGAFFIRQGLQRRLVLHLEHSSGRAWSWSEVQNVTLGEVRLLDGRGLLHASPSCQTLQLRPLRKAGAEFRPDGTSIIEFTASWDSSAHDSPFLDRPTAAASRVLLRLAWQVKASGCEPVPFSMDLGVTIQGRDARGPSRLFSALSSTRMLSSCTSLFAVTLKPQAMQDTRQLWRRDTSKTYGV